MKTIIFLLLISLTSFAQTVEQQLEILTRHTAQTCKMAFSYKEYKKILDEGRVDYVMLHNADSVNVFYYQDGSVHILKPNTTDIFLTSRDITGNVTDYPTFFIDKSSWDKKLVYNVGLCVDCKNAKMGVQYGSLYRRK